MSGQRLSPAQARARPESGSRHRAAGHLEHPGQGISRRLQAAARQGPFATVVPCTDSRVPPETVFGQGPEACSPSAPAPR